MQKIALLLLIITLSLSAQNVYQFKYINKQNLLKTDKFLCSKQFGGRLAGSEGFNKISKWAAAEFKKARLKSFGNSFYQNFNIEYNKIEKATLIIDDYKISPKLGGDFSCRGFTGSGTLKKAKVVFCGYGTKDSNEYDDYKNADVKGKVVLIFKQNPSWGGKWMYDKPRDKANFALSKGAVGVLFVSVPNVQHPQEPIGSTISGDSEQKNIPQIHITTKLADILLKMNKTTLSRLQNEIDSLKKEKNLEIDQTISLNVLSKYRDGVGTQNIVGYLEGNDPQLKNEYILVGAHLDHVGTQGNVQYSGANDNASGSSALLNIIKEFSLVSNKIKRSVIFVLFSAEEHGLDGSKYFVDHSPIPLSSIKYMINMDCIGFGDSIQIGGGKSNPELWEKIKNLDTKYFNLMIEKTWPRGGADAEAFFNNGIKIAYFVTYPSYKYLHVPEDLPETLNLNLFEKISQLSFLTSYKLAAE